MQRLQSIDTWIFDLDDTLYPYGCELFTKLQERMNLFIEETTGLSQHEATALRKSFVKDHGTSLKGMMEEYKVDPNDFLDFIHQVDYGVLKADPSLRSAIERLPGRKIVYTNASQTHVDRVIGELGLTNLFDGSFDIFDANLVPKPSHIPFKAFCTQYDINPARSVFFEDTTANLITAKEFGLMTVLVETPSERSAVVGHEGSSIDFSINETGAFLSAVIDYQGW